MTLSPKPGMNTAGEAGIKYHYIWGLEKESANRIYKL